MLVVMNADSGAIEAALPIGAHVDTTRFGAGEAFASAGDGTLAVASQKDGKWIIQETVTTPKGARTMGLDSSTQKIYLPTAEFEPATTDRPKPKPNTFMIVEVGR